MNEEEKFDELLSSKLSERDFPFDELNWDEAERLIIQQENKKKTTRFVLIFSGGLLAGMLIMLPFIITTHRNPSDTIATISTVNQNSSKQNIAPRPVHEKESPAPVHSAFVSNNKSTGRGGHTIKTSSTHKTSRKASVVAAAVPNTSETPAQNNIIVVATTPTAKNVITEKTNNTSPTYTETVNQNQVDSVPASEKLTVSSPQVVTKSIAVNESQAKSTNQEESATLVPQTANKNIVANETLPNNNPQKKDTTKPAKNTKTPTAPITNTDRVYTPGLALNPSINKTDSNTNKTSQANPDDIPQYRTGDLHKNILSAYAGGSYSFGWNPGATAKEYLQGNGITPWGGILYTHYFAGNVALLLGVGYSEITNLNQTYTSAIVQYDFGANSGVTTVTPQKVYYMAFPLKVQYDIDNKNLIGIGCDYMLMMTTYSTLTTYKQNYFSETSESTEKQNGYTQGFSNTYWEFMLSYTRMITARFGVSFEYYHDLGYVENNTIPTLSQSEKNNGLRLVLSYQILK